jgi:four helix bundle protein
MTNEIYIGKYDLEERVTKFSEDVIEFLKKIQQNTINRPIINQIVKAATSIGANYCEADCTDTKKDFIYKIGLCKKESKESRYWFRVLAKAEPGHINELRKFWQEAHELNLIFVTIIRNTKKNM